LIIKKMRLQEQDSPTNKITVMTIIILTILIIFTAPDFGGDTVRTFPLSYYIITIVYF